MSIALASFLDRFFLGKKRYNRESWAESEGNVATHIHIQTQRDAPCWLFLVTEHHCVEDGFGHSQVSHHLWERGVGIMRGTYITDPLTLMRGVGIMRGTYMHITDPGHLWEGLESWMRGTYFTDPLTSLSISPHRLVIFFFCEDNTSYNYTRWQT